jgi:hypothetical protein
MRQSRAKPSEREERYTARFIEHTDIPTARIVEGMKFDAGECPASRVTLKSRDFSRPRDGARGDSTNIIPEE